MGIGGLWKKGIWGSGWKGSQSRAKNGGYAVVSCPLDDLCICILISVMVNTTFKAASSLNPTVRDIFKIPNAFPGGPGAFANKSQNIHKILFFARICYFAHAGWCQGCISKVKRCCCKSEVISPNNLPCNSPSSKYRWLVSTSFLGGAGRADIELYFKSIIIQILCVSSSIPKLNQQMCTQYLEPTQY